MITIYPSAIQQSSSFAVSASTALNVLSLPQTASLAGFSSANIGPDGPTLTVYAQFVCPTCPT